MAKQKPSKNNTGSKAIRVNLSKYQRIRVEAFTQDQSMKDVLNGILDEWERQKRINFWKNVDEF